MAQFDVHLNPGPMQATVPMVVVVQSVLFDSYRRRVVVPLVRQKALTQAHPGTRMNPVFSIQGESLVLHPLDMVSVALSELGPCVDSLVAHGQRVIDALDELLTRSWG